MNMGVTIALSTSTPTTYGLKDHALWGVPLSRNAGKCQMPQIAPSPRLDPELSQTTLAVAERAPASQTPPPPANEQRGSETPRQHVPGGHDNCRSEASMMRRAKTDR